MSSIEDMLWEQVEPMVYIAKEDFLASLEGWSIKTIDIGDSLGAAILVKGPDMHFTTFPPVRPIPMRVVRETLQPLIDRYGFARTRTPKDADRQHRFNIALGWVKEGEDEFFVTYRIEKLRGGH